jgi:polysaccharide biosynthesis/export protein
MSHSQFHCFFIGGRLAATFFVLLWIKPSVALEALVSDRSVSRTMTDQLVAAAPMARPFPAFRYQLGPGDRLRMSVFKVEGYAVDVEILSDGTINLPRLGSLYIWNLTLDQAKEKITKGYSALLRRPIVYLDLLSPRPVRIAVTGQVQRPGLYSLNQGGSNQLATSGDAAGGTVITTSGWPTLVDAIQRAGGITAVGDLSNITITRRSQRLGDISQPRRYDFMTLLRNGGSVENPLVHDGDTVTIGMANDISTPDLISTSSSTFAPDTITVNVVGEVTKPGPQQVRSNSPLSQAILSAGGVTRRASVHSVKLVRLEPDGSVNEKQLVFSPKDSMGSANNPPLRSGDIVVVDRHGWAKFNDSLTSFVQPIGPVLNAASVLRLLGGF